ncbi:MAG TPA: aminoacyl-tRNA hydrolase [Sphaerochaeta sp.]|jgi:PTH1 family peptidyl-tRNA hydrolase|nr:aminoacyl-tRNA hydrolase [Sphaerochaeta sp.]HQB04759.1 aminoacyl-tRNA hydrolase [Sphaerochaeta sp.]
MMIILGLGNPGSKYENTRHNAGFNVTDRLAAFFHVKLRKRCFRPYRQARIKDSLIIQPLTYMNRSGSVLNYFRTEKQLIVVCDQLDLPPGMIRIRRKGSSAGQRGLQSIIDAHGSEDFIRIYVGIGRPERGKSVVEYVLAPSDDPLLEVGIQQAAEALVKLLQGFGISEVMDEYNRKNTPRSDQNPH